MSNKTTKAKYHTTPADLLVAAAYLPKTLDGKPMYPGMDVWIVGKGMDEHTLGDRDAIVSCLAKEHAWVRIGNNDELWDASQIYSSKDAARKAGAE